MELIIPRTTTFQGERLMDSYKEALMIPITQFNTVFASSTERKKLLADRIKESVFELIEKQRDVTLTNIMDRFRIKPDEALFVLNQLESEGRIKVSE